MKYLAIAIITLAASQANAYGCFFSYETTSGMNKICVYSCPTGDRAITVSAVSLCPISL
jgi:hypothetical protein